MIGKGKNLLRKFGRENPLAKNMLVYSFGSLGSRAINFAIYPILTFYLLKEDLGYYDLVVNTIFLVIPLATLQYADGIYRAILPLQKEDIKKGIIASGVNFIGLASFTMLGALIFLLNEFFDLRFPVLIFLMAFLFGINQSEKQIVRGLGKNKIYVIGDILYSFIFITALLIMLLALGYGLYGVFLSFIGANLFSIAYLSMASGIGQYINIRRIPSVQDIRPILNYSLPLIPNTLSWWLVGSANTYIISLILGLEYNGIYSVAYKVSSVIYLFNKVFSLAWQDELIAKESQGNTYYSRILNRLVVVLLLLALVVILLMKPLLKVVVEASYFVVWQYIPYLLLAAVFSSLSSYFGAFYLRWKTTSKIFVSTLFGAVIAVASSVVLTWQFGLLGTSISMMAGFGAVAAYRYWDTRKQLELKFSPVIPLLVMAIVVAIILTYYL